jgi:hypothetical protein
MFEKMGMDHEVTRANEALSRLELPRPKKSKGRGGKDD